MRNNSSGIRAVRPFAGVMTLMCPKCQQQNELRYGEDNQYTGTLFIPVSLVQKAAVEAGYSDTRKVQCHQMSHEVTVTLRAQ